MTLKIPDKLAKENGWLVVSVKNDWESVFKFSDKSSQSGNQYSSADEKFEKYLRVSAQNSYLNR